jgi:DNA-binding SARP family transcriptional activator
MPPAPETVLSMAALWLAFALVVPKRNWRTIRLRLQATCNGERRHPFGPPLPPRSDVSSKFLRLLAAEAPRCLELGIPLWLAALRAEYLGSQRRRLAEAEWASSPTGWTWAHLRGRINEEELHKRLSDGSYPSPAAKARLRFRLQYTMPPMSWLRHLDEDQLEAPPNSPPAADGQRQGEAPVIAKASLTIQTHGSLKVCLGDADLTAKLHARPTVSFLWQYLLVRAMDAPGQPIPRSVVADELYPGVDRERQLERLRKRLFHMQGNLPELSRRLGVTERDLMLDTEACQVDALEILQLASENRGTGLLPEPVVAEVEAAIAAAAAEFLPDWDDLQQTISGGRGTAEEYVRNMRSRMQEARVGLLARLGSHFLARREAGRAASILDEAFRLDPERKGLAQDLATALEAAGHRARAAEVRRGYVQRE